MQNQSEINVTENKDISESDKDLNRTETDVSKNQDISELNKNVKISHAEMLLNISKTLAGFESLDGMLAALVDIIVSEVDADRATVFLHDKDADELYSRVALGSFHREIRVAAKSGVAGNVFSTGKAEIVNDAYTNKHFDSKIDEKTGFKTRNILGVPIKTVKGEIIGVTQVLNKRKGGTFTDEDLNLVDIMMTQAALALKTAQIVEQMRRERKHEKELLDVIADITSEINLFKVLQKVMQAATKMLDADRSTLFMNDENKEELFSKVGEGLADEIRLQNHLGIAGAVFTKSETINIPYAYADLRFNPAFDKKTGYFTRSILCVPVVNKNGKTIGVIQVLNKRKGPFVEEDEYRLKTFTAQVSIALENAKLFDDVQNSRKCNEGMLNSMSSGVITINKDEKITTCNAAGLKILDVKADGILKHQAEEFFTGTNVWILEKIKKVGDTQQSEVVMDAGLEFGGKKISVNVTVLPLVNVEQKKPGSMLMVEDISSEKRMKSTMSRYMDPDVAEQLLAGGEDVLGGKSVKATVLFSDIRGFTTLTEELGAQGTVSLLNDYFTIMVDCIQHEKGMLDKFIGDAIMAAFGVPLPHDDDEDRGVRAAISMLKELSKWNKIRMSHGQKMVDMGIGLNTGTIVTGNIGSPKRMDYTMIGDGVNLASRLESACKQYFTRIIISEFTMKKLRENYIIREIDKVVVKGKTEPVAIYEVMDYYTEETFPNLTQVVDLFKEGMFMYRKAKWDNAIESFKEAADKNPNDKLTRLYIERCEHLKESPPEGEWDGVWVMKTK